MTMSSQPLSHESGNYMQQMKHALWHAAGSKAARQRTQKLKCQGKTKLNSSSEAEAEAMAKAMAKVKVNPKVKYLECAPAPAQGAATAAHRHGSHKVSAVPAAAAVAQCPEVVKYL